MLTEKSGRRTGVGVTDGVPGMKMAYPGPHSWSHLPLPSRLLTPNSCAIKAELHTNERRECWLEPQVRVPRTSLSLLRWGSGNHHQVWLWLALTVGPVCLLKVAICFTWGDCVLELTGKLLHKYPGGGPTCECRASFQGSLFIYHPTMVTYK